MFHCAVFCFRRLWVGRRVWWRLVRSQGGFCWLQSNVQGEFLALRYENIVMPNSNIFNWFPVDFLFNDVMKHLDDQYTYYILALKFCSGGIGCRVMFYFRSQTILCCHQRRTYLTGQLLPMVRPDDVLVCVPAQWSKSHFDSGWNT